MVQFNGVATGEVDNPNACSFRWTGMAHIECVNPDGSIAWVEDIKNANTTAGINSMIGVYFNSVTQITTWYIGLVANSGFSSFAVADTMGSHTGWTEDTNYSESVRQTWGSLSVSGGAISGATLTFTMNGTTTIYGIFVTSSSTKSGTSGTLWGTAPFSSTQSVVSGQTLRVTYSGTMA